jgi:hypothetical protein
MCLASALNATSVPGRIQIRFEGALPGFYSFYLEQLAEFARFRGVDFTMSVAKSTGVRAARDWQIEACPTPYLWMADDDVVYDFECLDYFALALLDIPQQYPKDTIGYICGTKGDLNNRRGWGNFKMDIHKKEDVFDNCAFNWFYDKNDCHNIYAKVFTCDTGNVVIPVAHIRERGIRFQLFEESLNSGGEDTLFALECNKADLTGFIAPCATSFHLEKPVVRFNEHSARAEMVLRAAEVRGYKKEAMDYVRKSFFPWLWGK